MRLIRYENSETVDMRRLLMAVFHKLWLVIVCAVLCAVVTFAASRYLVTPMYRSAAMFYVNNRNISVNDALASLTSEDIRASRSLVETYVVILNARTTLEEVIDRAGIVDDVEEIRGKLTVEIAEMITTELVNDTEIFRVVVEGKDPVECEKIADAIAEVLPQRIASIIEGSSARIVDAAVIPHLPSSPNEKYNMILGGMFGFVLGFGIIAIREMYDTRIRSVDELLKIDGIAVLSEIPDMNRNTGRDYAGPDVDRGSGI